MPGAEVPKGHHKTVCVFVLTVWAAVGPVSRWADCWQEQLRPQSLWCLRNRSCWISHYRLTWGQAWMINFNCYLNIFHYKDRDLTYLIQSWASSCRLGSTLFHILICDISPWRNQKNRTVIVFRCWLNIELSWSGSDSLWHDRCWVVYCWFGCKVIQNNKLKLKTPSSRQTQTFTPDMALPER